MSPHDPERLRQLFAEASELSGEERESYLDETCAGDAGLRAALESLLIHDGDASGPFGPLHATEPQHSTLRISDGVPERIGPYRILETLGEGGMGVVYLAEQEEPLRRRVALKVIKWGMDTKEVVARFEAERQALALMDHLGIAKVFDAGATEEGRPYFVMECVRGERITAYCDRQRLTTRKRLELFVQVCEAVQHAHQKGIIHRDLKPANILVVIGDGRPVPKIIDFGVAKATEQRLTEQTVYTRMGMLIGTPEYMSPEQAEMTGLDIDTRTDVYALGVLLYELLVGSLPFDPGESRKAGFDEIRRRIREEEPSRPSTRIGTLPGGSLVESASKRQTDPRSLRRQLSGDLDWITMKALEKDRARRYGSPADLAADVVRHLAHEPVMAGPPDAGYRMRKFVRRHRAGVFAALLVVVALLAGAVVSTVGFVRARRAEAQARQEAAKAERVSEFLSGLFRAANPFEDNSGESLTAREILDRGAGKIRAELQDEPAIRAELLETLGWIYIDLGFIDRADEFFEQVLEIRETTLGGDPLGVSAALHGLGKVRGFQGRLEESRSLLESALEIRRNLLEKGDERVIATVSTLAGTLDSLGDHQAAGELYQEAVDRTRATTGPRTEGFGDLLASLARSLMYQGKWEEAEVAAEEAVRVTEESFGADSAALIAPLGALATLHHRLGRYRQSEELLRRQARIVESQMRDDHPYLAAVRLNLSIMLEAQGYFPESAELFEQVRPIIEEAYGADSPHLTSRYIAGARTYIRLGDYARAEELLLRAIANREEGGAPTDWLVFTSLGQLYRLQGRLQQAEPLFARALAAGEESYGTDHLWVGKVLADYALLRLDQGRREEAEEFCNRALAIAEKTQGPESVLEASVLHNLGLVFTASGRHLEAEESLRRALEIREQKLRPDHPDIGDTLRAYAGLLDQLGRRTEAAEMRARADGIAESR